MPDFAFQNPDEAIHAWLMPIEPLAPVTVDYTKATGRVLAQHLSTDRDSPACDVSAMDGIALALTDLQQMMPITGEVATGHAPPRVKPGDATRCFTGGAIPDHCDTIIRREDLRFVQGPEGESVEITVPLDKINAGQNVRLKGENLKAGDTIVPWGSVITPAVMGTISTTGQSSIEVATRPRVNILTTGNELLDIHSQPEPWQIRDSNGPALYSHFANDPRVTVSPPGSVSDDLQMTTDAIHEKLEDNDLLIMTGGVSMGDHDYVPQALRNAGCRVIFHKLPIRPGKPILAAVGPQNQVILGLPGNPVSAIVGARIFAEAAIRHLSGQNPVSNVALVTLTEAPRKAIPLWHYLPVVLESDGMASIVPSKGSGDIMAAAKATGLVRIPPDHHDIGPFPYYSWTP